MYWLNCYKHKNVDEYKCNFILKYHIMLSEKEPKFKMDIECKLQSEQPCFIIMWLIYFINGNAILK